MRFYKLTKLKLQNSDISTIDEQNAWKWFKYGMYKQAYVLFEKINNTRMAKM